MKIIFDYNRTLFNPDTDTLYHGVVPLLVYLSTRCELFLVSRNEPDRANRLQELGILQYFTRVAFVEDKTLSLFLDLVGSECKVVVIGDCVFDEIRIGNELGFATVWVQQGRFAEALPTTAIEQPTYTVPSIASLREFFASYEI
jgi:FMN phosphatase YigB (HAD superfamily)